jgi:hypothetical protein
MNMETFYVNIFFLIINKKKHISMNIRSLVLILSIRNRSKTKRVNLYTDHSTYEGTSRGVPHRFQ